MDFETVIGLEVHVELSTKTKIYCGCTTEFGGKANTHVCPICMALPGSLPQLNKAVVEYAMRAGLALNCGINQVCRMDRKNYFYPDSPKNYQITQDEIPICKDGYIDIELEDESAKRIRIQRIHMEEDAGKLLHTGAGTMVDFNRAGVPLIEIVSHPDMRSPQEASAYLTKLKSILSCVGVSDCKMEEGSLRCDANVSVRPKGSDKLGARTEIKNMNSFKALEKAIAYEFNRQVEAVTKGEKLTVETRRWDEAKEETIVMRSKEMANDYRYFPEGDLVTINIPDEWVENVKNSIPELPYQMAERFISEYGIPKYDAKVLTLSVAMAQYFDEAAKLSGDAKAASNWLMGDISRLLNEKVIGIEEIKFTPAQLSELIKLISSGKISNAIGKKVIEDMFETGKSPEAIVEEKGLIQNNDEGAILEVVNKVIDANPDSVEAFKNGKTRIAGFLVGLIMKETKGKANPQIVNKLVSEELQKR
ncbi:Asp-tRNA(Asn)/Glu-tRNA(Gln) amidotransferase subunit GatB [Clostridium sp. 19966]|uniref:Asp-tRNA(Asn)/Glu-tRNA(Gln) amidotransferase subunit GatB n=1 Tax=Clostridium sp. 19966 TaxID=2768166 RepID=UPI0028DDE064|nr:Asp-tRNA(Asn)/Glu-tRNA(Gln) amidotransferase subunit GatB [Clostridium sp. 19966]MDT8715399.1 Asp-tRNA(Asn)/Glu-tRNA(Gln) amidotransferase subunit GatB [Clostridium sp. 19966]